MANDGKFLNLSNGVQTLEIAVSSSAGAGDANKIPKLGTDGKLDGTLMPTGFGSEIRTIQASENLASGDLVNIHNSSGPRVRKADATTSGKEAHGFVLASVTSGQSATVYPEENVISGLTGLTPGDRQFLATTAGARTTTAPSATGNLVQEVGVALSTTEILFRPRAPIVIA